MAQLCYINGKYVPLKEAKLSIFDIGFLRSFGVFDALPTFNRVPFRLTDHFRRFRNSAKHLSLRVPLSDKEMKVIIEKLIRTNIRKGQEASVRLFLTGGTTVGALGYDPNKPTFAIIVNEIQPLEKKYLEKGCSLYLFDHLRPFASAKTVQYIQAVILQKARKKMGALEVLYAYNDRVLECATSNFFIVKDGAVITAQHNVLHGITRKVVLELAKEKGYRTETRDVTLGDMYAADEAFITSSFKSVVPVVRVGEKKIGNGKPGPITKELMRLYDEYTHASA